MRLPEKPPPSLEDFLPVAEVGAIRSRLGRWLALNRVGFGKMLTDYRPRWESLVEKFVTDGLITVSDDYWSDDAETRDQARKKVVSAARQTWQRVKTAKPTTTTATSQPVPTQRPQPTVQPPPQSDDDEGLIIEPSSKFHSRPAVSRFKPKGPTDGEKT